MNEIIIKSLLGFISGFFLGITGMAPTGLILIILDYLHIGNYKSNLGAILFLNLFPTTIVSIYKFYKSNNIKIDYSLGINILIFTIIGSFIGSSLITEKNFQISIKTIKYVTSFLSFSMGIIFLISGYYENK